MEKNALQAGGGAPGRSGRRAVLWRRSRVKNRFLRVRFLLVASAFVEKRNKSQRRPLCSARNSE